MPLLRSKVVHLVSGITADILNPISDEPSKLADEQAMTSSHGAIQDKESSAPDGPDTSSFTAFLASLLSSSEAVDHPANEGGPSGHGIEESSRRKSLLSRGRHTLGKAIKKAAQFSVYRKISVSECDSNAKDDSIIAENDLRPEKVPSIGSTSTSNFLVISEPSLLLSESMQRDLSASLPALVQGRNWVLLYSTWRNGISLATLYRRSKLCPGYCLLVVGDREGAVFGGLVEAPLQPTNQRKYQGSNSSFVFTSLTNPPTIFRSTGTNHYYTLCGSDFLALGGGGHFALYLDGDLFCGSSLASETFGNSCLARSQDFHVKEVELWGFVYVSKYEEMRDLCRLEKPGIWRW